MSCSPVQMKSASISAKRNDLVTAEQFDALAQLMRLRQSPCREALRLVLVDGLTHAAAAEQTGAIRTDVTRRVSSAKRAMRLVGIASGRSSHD